MYWDVGAVHWGLLDGRPKIGINGVVTPEGDLVADQPLAVDQWSHVALVKSPTFLAHYVNGEEVARRELTRSGEVILGQAKISDWQGGRRYYGLVDEVRVYDVALSEGQMAAVMTGQVAPAPLSGMIGYWPGDGNADDMTGGHDGTVRNGATFAPGMAGQAFALDGTNDYIRIPHAPELTPASVTVEAWIKPDRVNKWMRIFCSQLSYQLNLSNRGEIASLIKPTARGGESYLTLSGGNVPVGEWSHVACTYDAPSGQWKLYVDGLQVAFDDLEDNNPLLPNTEDLRIGAIYSNAMYFDGLIDEVALYERALSSQEIRDIYQALNE
jgi:hypothetical protein